MILKRLIIFLQFLIFVGSLHVNGMPAYPKKIPVNVEDGVVYIRLFGDEHNKIAETLDGYSLVQNCGKWFFAEKDADGLLKPSPHKLSSILTDDCKQFLANTSRHLANECKRSKTDEGNYIEAVSHRQTVQGDRKVLVILMQYSDLSMIKSNNDFNNLFNGIGYSEDGAQGSVCDFYTDVSYGQLKLVCDVFGPFVSKYNRKYYGGNNRSGNDSHPEELFEEAIIKVAEQVSLKDYDADHDGYVDNVHVIFAGHGEEAGATDDAIWSHELTFYTPYDIQGMKVKGYSCAPELRGNSGNGISRIGPHCHEIGHALGAMDYYDTDYGTNGEYLGTGNWDVMASGSWNNDGITPADFNPYVKAYDFGWITPKDLPVGEVSIHPSYVGSGNYYILKSSYAADYYLIENRSKDKWGNGVPGEGMLLYHIHPDIASSGNGINAMAPQKCYVVCASSRTQRPDSSSSSYGNINSSGCPYPGSSNNTDFGQSSIPKAFFWDDEECGLEINNITIDKEGIIHLENNTLGIGDEDAERKRIFFEGFEEEDIKVSITNAVDNIFLPTWVIVTDPQEIPKFITQPSAYNGFKSLQLSAKKVTEKAESQLCFTIPEETAKRQLTLKFYANTLKPHDDCPNIIQVAYKTKDNDEWQYSDFISSENNCWQQCVLVLPDNVQSLIRIKGTAFAGSVLAIDNIEIDEIVEKDDSGIHIMPEITMSNISIFSLSGNKMNRLQSGINIIRQQNGAVMKLISR